MKQNNTVTRLA